MSDDKRRQKAAGQIKQKKTVFCVDCTYYAPYKGLGLLDPTCSNDECKDIDLVTGQKKVITCQNARKGKCGTEGKFFKQK